MHVVELLRGRVAVFAEVVDQVERVEAGVVRAHQIEIHPTRTGERSPNRTVLLRDDRVVHAGMVELPQERDGGKTESDEKNVRLFHQLPSGVGAGEPVDRHTRGKQSRTITARSGASAPVRRPRRAPGCEVNAESGRPGSNRRRPAWEAGILPLNYARSGRRDRSA